MRKPDLLKRVGQGPRSRRQSWLYVPEHSGSTIVRAGALLNGQRVATVATVERLVEAGELVPLTLYRPEMHGYYVRPANQHEARWHLARCAEASTLARSAVVLRVELGGLPPIRLGFGEAVPA